MQVERHKATFPSLCARATILFMTCLPPMDAPLAVDLLCSHCHYNLRTRLPSQSCPECNTPISVSLVHRYQWSQLLHNPLKAANALLLIAIGEGADAFLNALLVPNPTLARDPLYFGIACVLELLSLLLINIAFVQFVRAIRPSLTAPPGAQWRVGIIVLRLLRTGLELLAFVCMLIVYYHGRLHMFGRSVNLIYAMVLLLFVPSNLLALAIAGIALPFLRRLCKALGSPALTTATLVIFVVALIIVPLLMSEHFLRAGYLIAGREWFSFLTWNDLVSLHGIFEPLVIGLDFVSAIYFYFLSRKLRQVPSPSLTQSAV